MSPCLLLASQVVVILLYPYLQRLKVLSSFEIVLRAWRLPAGPLRAAHPIRLPIIASIKANDYGPFNRAWHPALAGLL
jgi:hypothetical protein